MIHVPAALAGQTLTAVLRASIPDTSWNNAKQLLASRRVSINGAVCIDQGRRVRARDVVHVFATPRTPQPTAADIELLYCDPHVVVVVKPALMTTLRHREERNWSKARKNLQPTLGELLPRCVDEWDRPRHEAPPRDRRRRQAPSRSQRAPSRRKLPTIIAVHRLDRDTSGVMVFARTPVAEQHLIRQFKRHSNDRVYKAVVAGHPTVQTIESQLVRDRGDGVRGSTTKPGEGERAVTHIRPLESLGDYSLIECTLETGRTHQIRIHLSELGHPVCGDPLYRKPKQVPGADDRSAAPRLALHAARLAFDHPVTNERLEFDAPLPDDLRTFIARLKRSAQPESDE